MLAVALGVFPGMCHQQQDDIADHPDGLPALLAVLGAILSGDMQRIFENELSRLKADAVLTLVPLALGLIPREHCSLIYVTTVV